MSGSYFKDKEPRELKGRVYAAVLLAGAAFFILAARLWYLQVFQHSHFHELSLNNATRIIKAAAPRGLIYDRLGVKVAENRPGFDLYIVPEDVKDWDATKRMLTGLVDIEVEDIDDKLEKSRKRPRFQAVKLKQDLTWEETARVESFRFEMPGVLLEVAPKRSYVFSEAVSHVLGYLGEISEKELKERESEGEKYSAGDLVGKYGLEKYFEKELRGVDGGKEVEVDAVGRKIRVVNWRPPYPGNDLKLTIDVKTQVAAWAAMREKVGAAVAMDPKTGKILAMVSSPSFDANALSSRMTPAEWKAVIDNPFNVLNNRAIQGQYPPASTYKPIHAAAALEEGVISPGTKIFSGPSFWFAGRAYRDWKEEGHGHINVHKAIVQSSDTFFYQVGLKLGVDRLAEYSRRFGFGSKTGVPLHGEKPGLVPSSEWKRKAYKTKWYEGETISVSVGQGYMLSTPLQLLNAYAAIANGGTLWKPILVDEITTPEGKVVYDPEPEKNGELGISEKTMEHVRNGLAGVTHEDGGTARFLSRTTDLKIAGKTGTAQVARLIKRTRDVESIPYKLRDHAWFAGFAPYDDPQIAVVVIVEHGGFGATAAAPVAKEIFKAYLGGPEGLPEGLTAGSGAEEGNAAGITSVRAEASR
ncbi:MAG: penicillin-binding protein 2 [Deltaproteobacteria bacterium]|nr:penicillin-binding protein 2 [Deltaproteobacteria bacterium]MCL4872855.1 penicillin-binding protein 2 [bacterium]